MFKMVENCFRRIITVWFVDLQKDELWARQRLFPMMLNLRGGHRASASGGQPSWQPQHVWKTSPGHCWPADFLRAPSRGGVFTDGPPTAVTATGIFDVRWGWAPGPGVEVGFDRLREGHGSGGERGPGCETISGSLLALPAPTLPQHLICYLSRAPFRTFEQMLWGYSFQNGVKFKM